MRIGMRIEPFIEKLQRSSIAAISRLSPDTQDVSLAAEIERARRQTDAHLQGFRARLRSVRRGQDLLPAEPSDALSTGCASTSSGDGVGGLSAPGAVVCSDLLGPRQPNSRPGARGG